jgi:hypothetical protein
MKGFGDRQAFISRAFTHRDIDGLAGERQHEHCPGVAAVLDAPPNPTPEVASMVSATVSVSSAEVIDMVGSVTIEVTACGHTRVFSGRRSMTPHPEEFEWERLKDPDWEPPAGPYGIMPAQRFTPAPPVDYPVRWNNNDDGDLEVTITLADLRPHPPWRDTGDDVVLVLRDTDLSEVTVTYTVTAHGYGSVFEGDAITLPVEQVGIFELCKPPSRRQTRTDRTHGCGMWCIRRSTAAIAESERDDAQLRTPSHIGLPSLHLCGALCSTR